MNISRTIAVTRVALLLSLVAMALSILPVASPAATQPPPRALTAKLPDEDLTRLSDTDLDKRIEAVGQAPAESKQQQEQPWDPPLVKFLTTEVLVFGIIVIIVMGVLVLNKASTGEVLRLFTVPMIIVAAVFLVVTGFDKDQITPVTALLGTLAGYILGVQSQKGGNQPSAKPPPSTHAHETTPPPPR